MILKKRFYKAKTVTFFTCDSQPTGKMFKIYFLEHHIKSNSLKMYFCSENFIFKLVC